ncbi:MFS transporter [Micromonospora sp. CPCC 206061]|uniref:MFS transporter n=1 Tax=Micromonospora sp. CPCC 206061 TaxID=3122410 RepID=UPI002FF00804
MPSAFARLWTAQSASDLGTYVSFVALPLVAVVELDASATELGLLVGAGTAPLAFAWPLFGVLADRVDRRRMMAVTYAGRALLYTWVPLAAATGVLTMTQLVVAYFLATLLKVGFDVAAPALLPALVNRNGLLAANSRLEATRSLAMAAGPALGGALAGVIRPSAVIALDAAAYLTAAVLVVTIRPPGPVAPHTRAPRAGVLREMRDGIAAVRHHPLLRPMATSSALLNAFYALRTPLVTLYVVRDLGMPPAALGAILAAAGPGALLGSLTAAKVGARLGFGRTIVGAALLAGAPVLLVPLVTGRGPVSLAALAGSALVVGFGVQVYNVTLVAGRQAITPDHLLGRVTATFRWAAWAATPFAAAASGPLSDTVGVRTAIGIVGAALLLPALRLMASGVHHAGQITRL